MSNLNDLLNRALDSIRDGGIEEVPVGFYSMQNLARQCGVSRRTMQDKIDKLLVAGLVERRDIRLRYRHASRIIPHYRILFQREHHAAD